MGIIEAGFKGASLKHISKGYIYFAMAFSVFVEMLNLKMKKPAAPPPIELRGPTL